MFSSIKCRNVQLHEISYHGLVSPRIVQQIFGFPTLRSVVIQPNQPNMGSADVQSLRGLENLTELEIHLGIFQTNTSIGNLLVHMPSLLTLRLSGSWKDISPWIQDGTCGSLQSLSLFLDPWVQPRGSRHPTPQVLMNRDVFSRISAACPCLQSLHLALNGRQPNHAEMTISDILSLRERQLEILELQYLPVSLSTADVIEILRVWPSLKYLCILPPAGRPFNCQAKDILSYMSNHTQRLQSVDIPLDFLLGISLLEIPRCVCPLQKLKLSHALNLPQHLPEKLTLGRSLLSIFPRLTTVTTIESGLDVSKDLQTIINFMQDNFAFAKGRDHFFKIHAD